MKTVVKRPAVAAVAEAARLAGISVLPPREDGSKAPLGRWKQFQARHATDDEFAEWYGPKTGVGFVCGAVSGGLELFEFDDAETYDQFKAAANALGLGELVARIEGGYLERSPGDGWHLLYYCPEVRGSTELAKRYKRPDEFTEKDRRAVEAARLKGNDFRPHKILIETRGEGGYVVVAPSNGKVHPSGGRYELLRGGVDSIVTVTEAERDRLWALATSFDQVEAPPVVDPGGGPPPSARKTGTGDLKRPGDYYNESASWADVLEPYGWARVYTRGETTYWRRPGKSEGWSATTNHAGSGLLWVFTSSSVFQSGKSFTKFGAFAILNHGGNWVAAAQALKRAGYCDPTPLARGEKPTPADPEARPRGASSGGKVPPADRNGHGGDDRPVPIAPREAADDPHRLARIYRDGRCYHAGSLKLRHWRGTWWRWDGAAYRIAMEPEIRAELANCTKAEFDRINIDAILNHRGPKEPPTAHKVTSGLVGNVTLALTGYTLVPASVEQPSWLEVDPPFQADQVLAARNTLVHLPSLAEGRPHTIAPTPAFFASHALDYDFDPAAPEPETWHAFLKQVWPDDPETIKTLQEWMGYLLTPDTSQQKILSMIGPPRSGKGTIARVTKAMIGAANVAAPTLSSLAMPFGLAPLIGKSVAIVGDAQLSGRTDSAAVVERLLGISGEDDQTIDRKHLDSVTMKLPTRFMLSANEIPKLKNSSGALVGRMILLRFKESFQGREDSKLTGKLLKELPGILLWAIAGWQRLRERGHFVQPPAGEELVREMGDLSSPIGAFVRECCDVGNGREADVEDVFKCWKLWAAAQGKDKFGDKNVFGRDLRAVVPGMGRGQRRRGEAGIVPVYKGFALNQEGESILAGNIDGGGTAGTPF